MSVGLPPDAPVTSLLASAVPRFGGWFQPWVLALILGLPTVTLLLYRARDLRRWVNNRAWRRRARQDWTER